MSISSSTAVGEDAKSHAVIPPTSSGASSDKKTTTTPSPKKHKASPGKASRAKSMSGDWTPEKRIKVMEAVFDGGYKAIKVDELAKEVSSQNEWEDRRGSRMGS